MDDFTSLVNKGAVTHILAAPTDGKPSTIVTYTNSDGFTTMAAMAGSFNEYSALWDTYRDSQPQHPDPASAQKIVANKFSKKPGM